ncbi:uncharacterized protein MYCFIDRAFT_140497 [Pseudocercospora fijiensis CIRAD86]|uniref:Cns1/TTC4 wheel domain-containing protein n=1 Tax=Pseudocercospora fijiensis (strain CIRAD86) TaxID=383855 RepID=M3AVF6_PSEFD|nr:uncharacterized protein MYCFIDRAFT_140497 [Pseudocercospora fijiensis CIRAD86]EME81133.1 hypothetical protein MYCFIDRAFT_140497 [Pseudocercospora fijiensis CIRAD86]
MSAQMPPGMRTREQKSADEVLKELNRVPLFMTSLDETDGEGGENVMLEAIKALAYEGTKAEVAANFREQGNEQARAKNWKDARDFYTQAIQTLRGTLKTTEAEPDASVKVIEIDEEAEAKKEREHEEACLVNRALCNLEMKNYGSCNTDCAAALRLNPKNAKAWYRAASACLALDKIPEALDACTSGLQFDASNAALKSLLTATEKRRDYITNLQRERAARKERTRSEQATLRLALKSRNILSRETESPPEMEDAKISLADANDPCSVLSFPVLFLYPLHAQTDFIKAFQENETLLEHLQYILPVPWDEKQEYSDAQVVECYMETVQGGLIKAGKKLSLMKLLGSGKLEIVDGLVRVYVVPKARASEWIEQFKARRSRSM